VVLGLVPGKRRGEKKRRRGKKKKDMSTGEKGLFPLKKHHHPAAGSEGGELVLPNSVVPDFRLPAGGSLGRSRRA